MRYSLSNKPRAQSHWVTVLFLPSISLGSRYKLRVFKFAHTASTWTGPWVIFVLVCSVLNSQVWVLWDSSRSIIMFEVFLPPYWRELWLYVITCQPQFYDRSKKSCWLLICSALSVVRTLVMTSKLLICQTKMNYLFLTFS